MTESSVKIETHIHACIDVCHTREWNFAIAIIIGAEEKNLLWLKFIQMHICVCVCDRVLPLLLCVCVSACLSVCIDWNEQIDRYSMAFLFEFIYSSSILTRSLGDGQFVQIHNECYVSEWDTVDHPFKFNTILFICSKLTNTYTDTAQRGMISMAPRTHSIYVGTSLLVLMNTNVYTLTKIICDQNWKLIYEFTLTHTCTNTQECHAKTRRENESKMSRTTHTSQHRISIAQL